MKSIVQRKILFFGLVLILLDIMLCLDMSTCCRFPRFCWSLHMRSARYCLIDLQRCGNGQTCQIWAMKPANSIALTFKGIDLTPGIFSALPVEINSTTSSKEGAAID